MPPAFNPLLDQRELFGAELRRQIHAAPSFSFLHAPQDRVRVVVADPKLHIVGLAGPEPRRRGLLDDPIRNAYAPRKSPHLVLVEGCYRQDVRSGIAETRLGQDEGYDPLRPQGPDREEGRGRRVEAAGEPEDRAPGPGRLHLVAYEVHNDGFKIVFRHRLSV